MYRYLLLLTCLLFPGKNIFAQKNRLLVALNPDECVSCINALKHISICDTALLDISFVLQQKYRNDSDVLVQSLLLQDYKVPYIWSDSLFGKITRHSNQSSVALLSSTGNQMQAVPLKNTFGPGVAAHFNRMAQKNDTISFRERIFSSGVRHFKVQQGILYALDELRQELLAGDMATGAIKYRIKMDEVLARKAFALRFGEAGLYDTAKAFAESLGIPKANSFTDFCLDNNGNLYVMGNHQYFYIRGDGDTVATSFSIFYQFSRGVLQNTYRFHGDLQRGTLYFYAKPRAFSVEENKMLITVRKEQKEQDRNYFLAQMRLTEDSIVFERFMEAEPPEIYNDYGYSLCDVKYADGYAAVTLADRFYPLEHPDQYIDIGYFPRKAGDEIKRMGYRMGINDFRVDGKYIYLVYWNGDRKTVCFMKYDIAGKKILLNKDLPYNRNYTARMQIDDFDFNYVYVPFSDYACIRMKME